MRKLKLQMADYHRRLRGRPEGQLDWMTWDMDEALLASSTHLTDTSDTILLGRKMTEGFIKYWGTRYYSTRKPGIRFWPKNGGHSEDSL